MSFKKFCPKCGKETNVLINKLCVNCFLDRNDLFTVDKINISVCKHCEKLVKNESIDLLSDELIAQEVVSKVKIIPELEQPKIFVEVQKLSDFDYEAEVKVKGFLQKNMVEDKKIVKFRIKETTCDSCMKLNASYREAIIQIRSKSSELADEMFEITEQMLEKEKVKNSLSGTSKIVELKNGYDLWIGSRKAAIKVARAVSKIYNADLKVSKKLIGEEQSKKRKYRFTFCVKKD